MIYRQPMRHSAGSVRAAKGARFRFRLRPILPACALAAACLLCQRPAARGDLRANVNVGVDANAVVRRMVSMYQSVQTLQERAEATMQNVGGKGEYIQTTLLKYSRANGSNYLYIQSTDPQDGTYEAYCNGKTITVYKGILNQFTKRAAGSNLRQNLQVLSKAAESLKSAHGGPISQVLNPASFLSAKGMPDECKNYRLLRQETIEGRRAYVVGGSADSDWLFSVIPFRDIKFDFRSVTLWIDAENSALLKAACDLRFHRTLPHKPNQPPIYVYQGIVLSETHHNIILNAPVSDHDFTFDLTRHKGASEYYQERR